MFEDEVVMTTAEYEAYVIARLETEFDEEPPDPADFIVADEQERFLDSRAWLLSSGAAHLDLAVAAERNAARAAAARARALTAFARSRPAAVFDRAPGERGAASAASVAARPAALTEVSEWAVDEAAATLRVSARAASLMLTEAVTLVEGLPATLAALSSGDISPTHARAMVELAGPVSTPEKRAQVEAAVLPRAARQTVAALRACVRRAVARIDAAAAADRLAKAVRDRHVRLDARDDGMSAMTTLWATPLARACYAALSAYAKACEYDDEGNRDPRTHQQRMSDCLADLVLRPHADRPAVQVALTLVAGVDTVTGHGPGADDPGEVDGDLVPAPLVRELAYQLGLIPRPGHESARTDQAVSGSADSDGPDGDSDGPDGDSEHVGPDDDGTSRTASAVGAATQPGESELEERIAALRAEELAAAKEVLTATAESERQARAYMREQPSAGAQAAGTAVRAALTRLMNARRLTDTALAERPRIAVTDQLTGTLLALTDSTELRTAAATGGGLGPPPGTDAYRPSDPLYRFVRLRDRRCRFPGCRARARCCDLDHQVPHPHGPTAHDNLACLCEHHHRLSHQAPGWRLHRDPDGGLVWTLPSGRTITTYPPAFGTDDGSAPAPSPLTSREKYAAALTAIVAATPGPPDPLIPF